MQRANVVPLSNLVARLRSLHRPIAQCVAVLALHAVLGLPSGAQSAGPDPSSPFEAFEITLADGTTIRGMGGLLPVPLVRGAADARTVHVEVYRFRALEGADPATPPVFLLNGGPGWPGVGDAVNDTAFLARYLVPFLRVADLVTVGQRGIGSSAPDTRCESPSGPAAGTAEGRYGALIDAARRCREHWEAEGYDLRGFSAIEAAGDVDDARRALGYDSIQLWGGSFGSHWGMAVLRYHGDAVARAVLAALEGPDHTYDDPAGVLAALGRVAADAQADPRLAPLVPEGGIIAGLRAMVARMEAEPVRLVLNEGQPPMLITSADFADVALGYAGRASSRDGLRTWPGDMLRLLHGDWSGAGFRIAFAHRSNGRLPTASFFMLDCGSGITAERHARYVADPAERLIGAARFYDTLCPVWDADLGDDYRTGFISDVPTLLVHGTWDTSTPLENARDLEPAFPNGRLVLVERGSHGALQEAMDHDAAFADAVMRFVATGSMDGLPARVVLPSLDWAVPQIGAER